MSATDGQQQAFEPTTNGGRECATCHTHLCEGAQHALRDCVRSLANQMVGMRMGLEATQNRLQAAVNHYG